MAANLLQMRGMLAYLRVPLGWSDLLKRSGKEALADNVFDLAAQQAYYFFFALFPALLAAFALASFFPLQSFTTGTVELLSRFAPQAVVQIIQQVMDSLGKQNSGGVLTFAFLVAVWSSSGAMVSIITTLNAAYDVTESRPLWKTRATAIVLTAGIAVFIIASMFLIIAGPTLATRLTSALGLGPVFKWAWLVLQWPLVFALVATGIGLVYYFAPDVEQDWVWITPGSVLATLLWLVISLALKIYYQMVPNANAAYGAIGGHASPLGKDPGERVPGEKKVVGPRAERLYEDKRARGEIPIKPIPDDVNCDIDRAPAPEHAAPKPSDLIIGAAALAPAAIIVAKKVRDEVKRSA